MQRKQRHGSYWKGTYRAAELAPYRKAAEVYLTAHLEDLWVAHALTAIQATLDGAGPWRPVIETLRSPPPFKTRAAFARLRVEDVPPLRLLVDHLAVTMAVKEDPSCPRADDGEYRLTQIGKVALRKASGYHSYYGPGNQYDRYPRSSGQLLRLIGRTLEECCEHVVEKHLDQMLALKVERYGERDRKVTVGKA